MLNELVVFLGQAVHVLDVRFGTHQVMRLRTTIYILEHYYFVILKHGWLFVLYDLAEFADLHDRVSLYFLFWHL